MLLSHPLIYFKTTICYPPFKNGLYLEEYFLKAYLENKPKTKRKYIPVLWTNFQIEGWFLHYRKELQKSLDDWVKENPCEHGYFTVVQHDDSCLLKLPINTIIYGSCSGHIPIPLIYEDTTNILENIERKHFKSKEILCSFIGNITTNNSDTNIRKLIFDMLSNKATFKIINSGGWNLVVSEENKKNFINIIQNSKFSIAPRGYGRSSFRFFEIFKLGSIPIYIWDDCEWLPFKNIIDYTKLCIVIHYTEIDTLEERLLNITEENYNNMLRYYEEIKYLFYLPGLFDEVIEQQS